MNTTSMEIDDLIERHSIAMGGREAIEGVQSIQVDFRVVEGEYDLQGRYLADRARRMRVDISIGGQRVFTEGFDGKQAWQLPQDATHGQPASAAGSMALAHSSQRQILGLHELAVFGYRMKSLGQEAIDGRIYAVIEQTDPDGGVRWLYISIDTWLVERLRESKALHPDIDPQVSIIETCYSDFRTLESGLVRAFHEVQRDLTTAALLQTTWTNQVVINPQIDEGLFGCP